MHEKLLQRHVTLLPRREAAVRQQQQLQERRYDPKGGNSSFMLFSRALKYNVYIALYSLC